MPNILFASNNLSHWPTAVGNSDTSRFNASRVPYSIMIQNWEEINSPVFPQSSGDETWFHWRTYATTSGANQQNNIFRCFDPQGRTILTLRKTSGSSGTLQFDGLLYNGNGFITIQSTRNLTQNKINSVDIQIIINELKIEARVYVNRALSLTLVYNENPNGYGKPNTFSLGAGHGNTGGGPVYLSEIIVADADTRNARLDLLRPDAQGAYDQWSGSLVDIADDDTTTGMTTIAGDQRHSMKVTPYSGARNVSNVVIASQTTRGQNSPTGLKHTVSLSGVDYDSALIPVGHSLQYNISDYKVNPATSLPWEGSQLSLVEIGFASVA